MKNVTLTNTLRYPMFLLIMLSSLVACSLFGTSVERDFHTMDLLITLDDMPIGWEYRDEPSDVTDVFVKEASAVHFIASSVAPPMPSQHNSQPPRCGHRPAHNASSS